MSQSAVSISQLGFSYPGQKSSCLQNINLEISVGERFGLFGPNGAGKTTLMSLMTGLLRYEKGSIKILDHEVKTDRKKVNRLFGFVPQDFSFYQELTPLENLAFFGAWSGMAKEDVRKKSDELLEVLSLSDVRDKQVQKFSGGMKRRVNLAIGMIHSPQVLFLDEPTVGVDVQTRQAIIAYLKDLNSKGTTLIYTSHQLSEAEELCERIALIAEGNILVHDSLTKLLSEHREDGLEGLFINLTAKSTKGV